MQALDLRENTPQHVTAASHPNAFTSSTKKGDIKLTAHPSIGKHDHMDTLLDNEVGSGATIKGVPGLIEALFPNDAFPIAPKPALAAMNKISTWHKDGQWQQRPPQWLQEGSEVAVADYMQRMCDAYGELLKAKKVSKTKIKAKTRVWTAAYRNQTLPGGFVPRKPDIVSVDPAVKEPTWEDVGSDVQIKVSPGELEAVTKQLRDGGLNVLAARDDRRFHIGMGVAGTGVFVLLQDRSGCLRSEVFDLNANPVLFLRIVLGLIFLSEEYIGCDPDFKTTPTGDRIIKIGRSSYQILERVDKDAGIRGPGSVRWRCQRIQGDKKLEIVDVKSSWVDRSREHTEDVYLKRANESKVQGVPTVVELVYVKHRGPGPAGARKDEQVSTETIRKKVLTSKQLKKIPYEIRDLTYLIQKESTEPLSSFRTLPELLFGLLDSVKAHKALCELDDVGILHTNINDRSVRLSRNSESSPDFRRGVLQDFNDARFIQRSEGSDSEVRTAATGLKSCVPTYTACEILMGGRYLGPEPYHDLESFFNLLLCQCIFYEDANEKHRDTDFLKKVPIVAGWMNSNMYQAGSNKWGVLSLKRPKADTFGNFIDEAFAPYFNPLKPCICELRRLVMNQDSEATHDEFIEILQRHAEDILSQEVDRVAPEGDGDDDGQDGEVSSDGDDPEFPSDENEQEAEEPPASPNMLGAALINDNLNGHARPSGASASENQPTEQPNSEPPVCSRPVIDTATDSSTTADEPADQSGSEIAPNQLATGNVATNTMTAARGKNSREEFMRTQIIRCSDPQCTVVYYHRGCAKGWTPSRESATDWHCETCKKRRKQSKPADDPVNNPTKDPTKDPAHDPANDPADNPVNDSTSDLNNFLDDSAGHQEPEDPPRLRH
ncbi:uncharacterized protein SCHCODRAFT_02571246 [Schizophyllum commune H4-8]|nr:uncharacterized protein SCHCODRAFT_02571246 [Schizophyllum commune H4-8]KAI5894636.1 hypothetical protein SCHCODRAFT_02571246 [Schizophyllum commune H4-8]